MWMHLNMTVLPKCQAESSVISRDGFWMMQCRALALVQLQPSNVDFKPREAVLLCYEIVVYDRRSSQMLWSLVLVAFDPGLYAVETAMTGALVPKQLSWCTDIKLCNRDDLIATVVGGLRSNRNWLSALLVPPILDGITLYPCTIPHCRMLT